MSSSSGFFSFPNPVNDVAARTVATGVVVMGLLVAGLGWGWVLVPLTYGFVARVLAGPRISPLGQIAVRVVAPRLPQYEKLVPGPAQAVRPGDRRHVQRDRLGAVARRCTRAPPGS